MSHLCISTSWLLVCVVELMWETCLFFQFIPGSDLKSEINTNQANLIINSTKFVLFQLKTKSKLSG